MYIYLCSSIFGEQGRGGGKATGGVQGGTGTKKYLIRIQSTNIFKLQKRF